MNICYWCGKTVLEGEGGKEHIVPETLLKDVEEDHTDFIIPKENAHAKCNNLLGNNYEHDFCQILFNYTVDDKNAKKHVASKTRNLKSKIEYAQKQFGKMKLVGNLTQVNISEQEKENFGRVLVKIIKGLFFINKKIFLDLEDEYSLQYDWSTFNLEHDEIARSKTSEYLKLISNRLFVGNKVFKYRFAETSDGKSSLWEFVFYNRFPAYVFLIHFNDKAVLKSI
jgi:hypothetical protein